MRRSPERLPKNHVAGAAEPQSALIAPGNSTTLTFPNVADLGGFVQPVVAISGAFRWIGAAADVAAGSTRDAGLLVITPSGGLEHLGAAGPGWRSDGTNVGFIFGASTCTLEKISATPTPGTTGDPLLAPISPVPSVRSTDRRWYRRQTRSSRQRPTSARDRDTSIA